MAPHVVRVDIVRDIHGQNMTATYIDQFIDQVENKEEKFLRKISMEKLHGMPARAPAWTEL